MPDRIADAPELKLGLNLYMQAFFDLDSERSSGFGPGRIPWNSVKEYAIAYAFDAEQTDDLFYFIREMDATYVKRMVDKMEEK